MAGRQTDSVFCLFEFSSMSCLAWQAGRQTVCFVESMHILMASIHLRGCTGHVFFFVQRSCIHHRNLNGAHLGACVARFFLCTGHAFFFVQRSCIHHRNLNGAHLGACVARFFLCTGHAFFFVQRSCIHHRNLNG